MDCSREIYKKLREGRVNINESERTDTRRALKSIVKEIPFKYRDDPENFKRNILTLYDKLSDYTDDNLTVYAPDPNGRNKDNKACYIYIYKDYADYFILCSQGNVVVEDYKPGVEDPDTWIQGYTEVAGPPYLNKVLDQMLPQGYTWG